MFLLYGSTVYSDLLSITHVYTLKCLLAMSVNKNIEMICVNIKTKQTHYGLFRGVV